MRQITIKIGTFTLNLGVLIIILILSVPFLNLWKFYGYPAKLYYIYGLLFILIFAVLVFKIRLIKLPKIAILLLIYLFYLSLFKNFPFSLEYFLVMLCGVVIMIIPFTKKMQNIQIFIIKVIGLFYAMTMIWQWISPNSFNSVLQLFVSSGPFQQAISSPLVGDYTGFACESNRAGLCIAPAASIFFSNFFFRKSRKKMFWNMMGFTIAYVALVLSGRRAFILFFPVVLLVVTFYILLKKHNRRSMIVALVLATVLFIFIYFYAFQMIIQLLTHGSNDGIALSNREIYWDLALRMYNQSPLFGNGLRSYDFYYNLMSGRNIIFAGAHNCYLQMLAEIGFIGTILYVGFIMFMIIKTLKGMTYCIKNNFSNTGKVFILSFMMQCMFILLALSESAFIAPYSLILYFIMLNLSQNAAYSLMKENRNN